MASSTTFSSTYPVLSTPPHPQSDSLPTDSSPFAEADRTISELIQAMANQTNVLDTSESAAPPPIRKTGLVFRGKPLAMALYKPKRKRSARTPKPQSSGSRKPRNGLLSRDATGKFSNVKSKPRDRPTEASSMDTTRTPATSEQVLQIVTEPVSPAAAVGDRPSRAESSRRRRRAESSRRSVNSAACVRRELSSNSLTHFSNADR